MLQNNVINKDHTTIFSVMPNNFDANPAVTTVTALCIVNIVARLIKKYTHK